VKTTFHTFLSSTTFTSANQKKLMDTNLEILNKLTEYLKFAVIRTRSNELVFMNEQALELFGYTSTEEVSIVRHQMFFADREMYYYLLEKQKAYGLLTNERVLFMRKDQTNFWGSLTSKSYCLNGERYRDEVIVDITAQINNEHKLREKELLLEKVAGELDRFVYRVSHDLRSPISTMKGLTSLVRMNSEVFTQENFLNMMEESLDRLDVFISKLVEFSRNSNEPVMIQPVDLNHIFESVLQEQQQHSNWSKAKVECSLPDSFMVYSDVNKIYTAISHVIRNSLDYCDASKCSFLLSIKGFIQQNVVTIEIVDNGIGIDKKFTPKVFQMFFRATLLSKGSGLGLFLAREAIDRLGGNITISSELNLGTLVKIQFPSESTSRVEETRKMA
jgi:signal transduction histidine kinase